LVQKFDSTVTRQKIKIEEKKNGPEEMAKIGMKKTGVKTIN